MMVRTPLDSGRWLLRRLRTGPGILIAALPAAGTILFEPVASPAEEVRRLPVDEYLSRMKAGWIGQMVGVGWGAPAEWTSLGAIIPPEKVPPWEPRLVNQFGQDDLYVEMTFLRTLELFGLGVSARQAGIDFANSEYELWHANKSGRRNLRNGISPPDSGHPRFTAHSDDIDYQIEADFAGLIAPGMPNRVIELGEKFGRLMNHGDGLYGGQFVAGMYAEAFFEDDIVAIIQAGLSCIPRRSQYAGMVRDVLEWYAEEPDHWTATWELVEAKYHKDENYTHAACSMPGAEGDFSIDAKLNGAYILIGLLYGEKDPDRTMTLALRCGQDSDCNPSNAGGILFTTMGYENLPERFTSALDLDTRFSHTPYDFPKLIEVSQALARQSVERSGGRIEAAADGREVFVIPVAPAAPSALEQSWKPGPPANSRYTGEELARITVIEE